MPGHWKSNAFAACALLAALSPAIAAIQADTVYRNGYIYTVDAKDSVQQALAVRGGRIVYVGDDKGTKQFIGKRTKVVDLQGRMLMPGLVDGHMHPQSGGRRLMSCSLNYEQLSAAEFQSRIQACLDQDPKKSSKDWMLVVNWFEQGLQLNGSASTAALLDQLKTERPIIVRSSFGHSVLLNAIALKEAAIQDQKDPEGGKIMRDASGKATGLLEDAAQDYAMDKLPPLTAEENLTATRIALKAMREQGITSFLDAYTDPETMDAYTFVQKKRELSARAHFAVLIDLDKPDMTVAELLKQRSKYDQGETRVTPSMQVRHAKLFMDGVINAPAFTGAMLQPYLVNRGTPDQPDWQPGDSNGPKDYIAPAALRDTLSKLAKAHVDPHIHVDGDRAVRHTLDAIAWLRARPEGKDVRPALAHDEYVDPADYPRFAQLNVTPVLSFQWAKPAPDTVEGLKDYFGPQRYALVEPEAVLLHAGARVAYGSDWPVDPLDEWFALKVGVTRTAAPDSGYSGALTDQPVLPRAAALRAITMNAAYTLRAERDVGSLEVGKLADMIILDRNFFTIPAEDIANIKVLQTVVGGKIVYEAAGLRGEMR
jgi:predicted amidohydrolase YtcJ